MRDKTQTANLWERKHVQFNGRLHKIRRGFCNWISQKKTVFSAHNDPKKNQNKYQKNKYI